jgi:hypothetical protein
MGLEMSWTGRPGPTGMGLFIHLLRGHCFSCLQECSPFYMWPLDVSFFAVWIELLVLQDLAFSVQVLRVFRLHWLVLGLL